MRAKKFHDYPIRKSAIQKFLKSALHSDETLRRKYNFAKRNHHANLDSAFKDSSIGLGIMPLYYTSPTTVALMNDASPAIQSARPARSPLLTKGEEEADCAFPANCLTAETSRTPVGNWHPAISNFSF
jgi:hypothetical protein